MADDWGPVHILLVEDEALIALAEQQMLERNGYQVTTAGDGESAFEIATTQSIDLILMDIDLGRDVCGGDVARKILSVRNIPLVFLTNHSDARTMEKVASIPRYGYVLKSNGEPILLEVIRLALIRAADRAAVEEARDLYQSIANLTGDIIVRHDAEGNWVYLNDRAYEVWGIPRTDPSTLNYLDYVEPEDRDSTWDAARQMRETHEPVMGLVNGISTVYGRRTYQWNSMPVFSSNGSYLGFQSTGRDITVQKEAEDRIRRLLEERELLLGEVHHRVKNDLNLVHSLLSLQSYQTSQPEARRALSEAGDRVLVLAGIYETLNTGEVTTRVSLPELITTITDRVGYTTLPEDVRVSQKLADITVPVRLSVAIGIVYNELITNSAKYALSGTTPARQIVVALDQEDGDCEVVLTVSDDGPGFPPEILSRKQYGYGLTVVDSLVSQHEGTLVLENTPGARVAVTLPTREPADTLKKGMNSREVCTMTDPQSSSAHDRVVREMGRNFARRARAAARKREPAIAQRHVAAMEQIETLVQRFKDEDPHLRAIVLFGSLAVGTPDNPNFDIDLAVDSDKYWELLGIALDQPIPVDLVDLPRAGRHIRSRIEAEGRWLYRHE